MKNFLIIFICIFALTSCFSGKNTENSENNSWSIISENSSQTGAENLQTEEKSEEKILPTEYEVITEKAYFYSNSTDTEPRKAYVMKWDKIIVDNEKSTENMIFATYTNSSWKTTEWFLKKSEIKAMETNNQQSEEKVEKFSNCKRVYSFAYWKEEDVIDGYRKFTFKLVWDCPPKQEQKIDYTWDAFRVATWQQAIFSNFMINNTWWAGWWCFIKNPIYSKKFQKDNFEIDMKWWTEYCSDGSDNGWEYSWDYLINIDIFEKWRKIINLKLEKLSKWVLEENYNDLLWTMENGFSEQWTQSAEEIKLQELHSIKWTKEKLNEWKFTHNGNYISFEDMKIATGLNLGGDCENEYFFGQKIFTECKVTKIDWNFIYWEYISWKTIDEGTYSKITSKIEYNKTHIIHGKTEKLKESYNNECFNGDISGESIPCPK